MRHAAPASAFPAASQTTGTASEWFPALTLISSVNSESGWCGTTKAAQQLNISVRTLRRWKEQKRLIPGIHYKRKGPTMFSHVVWNVAMIEQLRDRWSREEFGAD